MGSDWLSEHVMLASSVSGAGRRGKERKKVYLLRDCCEVTRPRSMKPPVGSGGWGRVELKETVKRDRMGKKNCIIRER